MSTSTSTSTSTAKSPAETPQQNPPSPSSSQTPLPLPPLPTDLDPTTITTTLPVGGDAVKLDKLGPLVVNKDGTLSRIANWEQMADIERANTLRILCKRNMLRREDLERKGRAGEGG
ncbi:conserved hypothetical protein [Pyrenophora tritici-repentis Pt-1C-BFP]|uniref:Uncharacterized protein n=2 Tax=Pyrenophora tritici-repentis TaxID=45151 RepID=A0A922T0Q8_9PLEO|nr:uncharacterized protein PTRG_11105 [Pyrenophora tritici-repentis Pt-1C-BFP]EDU44155.1 conserved hypothetical protein [Pyrenophora tritici-repentis Pt-1C-BFP]KAI1514587.1 hypothetical protein Ptr86124_005910 [Pyrenophora tritici-repentis]